MEKKNEKKTPSVSIVSISLLLVFLSRRVMPVSKWLVFVSLFSSQHKMATHVCMEGSSLHHRTDLEMKAIICLSTCC